MVEHHYKCVLERDGLRHTLNVWAPEKVSGPDLLPLAINRAIDNLEVLGIKAEPEDFAPIGYVYMGAI